MNSEEIRKTPIFEQGKLSYEEKFWLKEVAYQLAVMNERREAESQQSARNKPEKP